MGLKNQAQSTGAPPVSCATVRGWDLRAVTEYGIPSILLMENAARGCADLLDELARAEPGLLGPPYQVVCGPGQNGGDGLALGRHLHNRGREVAIHLAQPRARIDRASDAGINLGIAERMRLDLREPGPGRTLEQAVAEATACGVIVDALLGTGLTRPLQGPYLAWVEGMNRSGRPIVALDLPTGLDGDTGEPLGAAVRAGHTLTLAAPKLGFTRGAGPAHAGRVHVVEIGLPRELISSGRVP